MDESQKLIKFTVKRNSKLGANTFILLMSNPEGSANLSKEPKDYVG